MKEYMKKIEDTNESEKTPKEKEKEILELKKQIKDEFSSGLITENHYIILERMVDDALGDVRKDIIGRKVVMPEQLKGEVEQVLDDGLVTRAEYDKIAKKIRSSSDLTEKEKQRLNRFMRVWMQQTEAEVVEAEMDKQIAETEIEPIIEPDLEPELEEEMDTDK